MRRGLAVLALAVVIAGCTGGGGDGADEESGRLDTGGLAVGDPPDTDVPWVDSTGAPVPERMPPWVAVCDGREGCKAIVGFVARADLYPEFAPPRDPRNSQLGFQPGPIPVVDEFGTQVGWMEPDVGFVAIDEVDG